MGEKRRFYVVAYDIPSDRRRTKVHKVLSGFGQWTQYSLFELFLNDKEKVLLEHKLKKLLDPRQDSVRFYSLCESCLREVETIGSKPPEEVREFIV